MKTQKIKLGADYAIRMRTQYREKSAVSKKVYNKKDRRQNKVRF